VEPRDDLVVHPVVDAFAPVLGLPSWLVAKGHGSFVTLEFGEPRLEIGKPSKRPVFLTGGPKQVLARNAFVRGQWHLWIYCCDWTLLLKGAPLADNESEDVTMARALRVLNGQSLVSVGVDPMDGGSTFTFDLGCVLETRPAQEGTYKEEPAEQWMLYQPSGEVLTIRGDGYYRVQPARESGEDEPWTYLPGRSSRASAPLGPGPV
jgi:hypothetical protein